METKIVKLWMGPSISGGCLLQVLARVGGSVYDGSHTHSSGEGLPQPRLEEEIDSLAQELALKEQEAGHSRLTAQPLLEAAQKLLEPGKDPHPHPHPMHTTLILFL